MILKQDSPKRSANSIHGSNIIKRLCTL